MVQVIPNQIYHHTGIVAIQKGRIAQTNPRNTIAARISSLSFVLVSTQQLTASPLSKGISSTPPWTFWISYISPCLWWCLRLDDSSECLSKIIASTLNFLKSICTDETRTEKQVEVSSGRFFTRYRAFGVVETGWLKWDPVQGNCKHTQFSQEHCRWQDSEQKRHWQDSNRKYRCKNLLVGFVHCIMPLVVSETGWRWVLSCNPKG